MQHFDEKIHTKFKNKFDIKNSPSKIDKLYIDKTIKYIKFVKYFPWLKMVAIWNSIAMNASNKDSDIDLFIVTSPDSMWINRILFTIFFWLLWVRKTHKYHEWRFCLSFFATTNWLNFKDWKINDDIYLYFWIVYLKPILNYDDTYKKFLKANSSWADFSEYNYILKENEKHIIYS